MKIKLVSSVIVAGLAVMTASADVVLVNDNFNRPDGQLTGTAVTPGPGGVWENHSGTLGDMELSGGQAFIQHGIPSEDTHIQFAAQSTGILSATFDVTVNDDSVIGGGDYEYFAHFFTEGSFNFRSRVDIVAPNGSGDYTFGISSGSSTAEAVFATDFFFNTLYRLTLNFNLDTGKGSVSFGETTIEGGGIILGEALDSFSLRQSDSSNNETILVDNLVISTTIPEPSSVAMIGLVSGCALFVRKRFMI